PPPVVVRVTFRVSSLKCSYGATLAPAASHVGSRTLKPTLNRYERAELRCGHKVFGEIFVFASWTDPHRHLDFATHNAKQAFAARIKHSGPRISSARDVADHRTKLCAQRLGQQLRRHDARSCRAFWNR